MLRLTTWLLRKWRLLYPGHNPLARRVDRIEAGVLLAAIGLCLVAVPLALTVGTGTYSHEIGVSRQQTAQRHPSSAITLASTPPAVVTSDGGASAPPPIVPAQWEVPGAGQRSGTITVPPGTRAGTTVPIWLDQNDNLTARPLTAADAATLGLGVALLTWILAAAAGTGLVAVMRLVLDRRRAHRWDDEWERFGRQQSRS